MPGHDGSSSPAPADVPSTSASNTTRSPAELSVGSKAIKSGEKEEGGQSKIESDDGQGESVLDEGEEEEGAVEEAAEEEGEERGKRKASSDSEAPPLPDEEVPPLPDEAPPGEEGTDDGWEPVWDANAQSYYFYNRVTGVSQWENPRVPEASTATGIGGEQQQQPPASRTTLGGYNPAIHGDYDPTAPYAQQYEQDALTQAQALGGELAGSDYTATGTFNRFTGRWQDSTLAPENFNDENKSRRQMHAFFDVDAAANSHDGRSLKAERSGKKLTKAEVKAFRDKRRERKEEKRRAWLRD